MELQDILQLVESGGIINTLIENIFNVQAVKQYQMGKMLPDCNL